MKVSVVVPVFNTGEDLSRCADSVLGQTLDDYEVIFVDDGSDDGTEKRLDELAAAHERVRVIHLPPSGGPGGPRNVGIGAARGDYVYFLDDDDRLGPEALERMYAMAVRNHSDIVIGKMVGHGRRVPRQMFRESKDRADVLEDWLLGILTPHKLFRRAFLDEHRIRFPEGPVRLEDHRFVLTAYFRARTISVVADYPCCHWMKRAGSYSRNLPDPVHYYKALREVLDIVDEHVAAGPERDQYYAHWYRGKILKRLGEKDLIEAPEGYRRAVYEEARQVTAERFGGGVDLLLPVRLRVRSALLRAGDREDLFRLLEAERGARLDPVPHGLRWDGPRLVVRFGARLVYRDGTPFAFRDGRWIPPVPLPLPDDVFAATDEKYRLDLYIRRREDRADHPLPVTVEMTGPLAATGEAVIDPADPLLTPGIWDLVARVDDGGSAVERRLPAGAELSGCGRLTPYTTEKGNLSVRVRPEEPPKPEVPPEPDVPRVRRVLRRLAGARRAARGPHA